LEAEQPAYFMSYAQLMLYMAEAAENGWISGSAADYINAGIAASCESNEVDAPSIVYQGGAAGLEQIHEQMWVALYMQGHEALAEWRRTGVPNLPLAIDAVLPSIPTRFNYPTSVQSTNGANLADAV